jgi:release factor glutamine methyltransferase
MKLKKVRSCVCPLLSIFTAMLSYSQSFYELKDKLQPLYDASEAAAIAHSFIAYITGLSKADRLIKKDTFFSERQQQQYDMQSKELIKGKPLQYITNSAWFMGRELIVNAAVLIPRPETEELVQWVVDDHKDNEEKLRVLDIGSGSGCIGLSLAWLLKNPIITCADVSKEAIEVLKTNIEWVLTPEEKKRGADNITVKTLDFLNEALRNKQLGKYDVIVSNPPYIPAAEKKSMHKNVKDHEPGIALFVPDDDALVFYKAIAAFGKTHLREQGFIYCELDAGHADACKELFVSEAYADVEIRKDMHGNWRMLKAGGITPPLSQGAGEAE